MNMEEKQVASSLRAIARAMRKAVDKDHLNTNDVRATLYGLLPDRFKHTTGEVQSDVIADMVREAIDELTGGAPMYVVRANLDTNRAAFAADEDNDEALRSLVRLKESGHRYGNPFRDIDYGYAKTKEALAVALVRIETQFRDGWKERVDTPQRATAIMDAAMED